MNMVVFRTPGRVEEKRVTFVLRAGMQRLLVRSNLLEEQAYVRHALQERTRQNSQQLSTAQNVDQTRTLQQGLFCASHARPVLLTSIAMRQQSARNFL
jgi:hypothetical protein